MEKKQKTRKKKNYLNNKDLYEEILKSKKQGKLTEKALEMLILLAQRTQRKLYYNNQNDKNDCFSFAVYDLLRYWDKFNPEKSKNAFAYFTSICVNGYAKGWNQLYPHKLYKNIVSLDANFDSDENGIYSI